MRKPRVSPLFGSRLVALRRQQGFSQCRLAREAGVDRSLLSRYEAGSRRPSAEVLERILAVLALDPDDADAMRVLAGFAPHNPAYFLAAEPVAQRLVVALFAHDTPDHVREALRRAVASVLDVSSLCLIGYWLLKGAPL